MLADADKKYRFIEYTDFHGIILSNYMFNVYTGRPLVYILYYMC